MQARNGEEPTTCCEKAAAPCDYIIGANSSVPLLSVAAREPHLLLLEVHVPDASVCVCVCWISFSRAYQRGQRFNKSSWFGATPPRGK